MRVPKRLAIATLGVSVAAVLLGASVASADPVVPGGSNAYDRPLHGEGSDTLDDVMNALAEAVTINGNKAIASWNALSSNGFVTRDPAVNAGCTYTGNPTPDSAYVQGARANGSGNGQKALRDAFTSGQSTFGCLDFSRSSSLPSASNLGTVKVAAVPLATDSLTFALSRTSSIPRQLTAAQLKAAYKCQFGGFSTGAWKAYLPQAGSGTRKTWESFVGISDADVVAGVYPCIADKIGTDPIQEHDGRVLNNTSIVPISTAQWIAQMGGASPDIRGNSMLGTVKSTAASPVLSYPISLNQSFGDVGAAADNITLTRTVYNVLPTSTLTGGANENPTAISVFTDTDPAAGVNTSLICQRSDIIAKFGFAPIATCGSTATIVN